MLFNSFDFAAFFLVTFFLYYLSALRRYQLPILVLASFVFYSWKLPWLLCLLIFSIAANTIVSFQVAHTGQTLRKTWAMAGVIINLAILGFFKYAGLIGGLIERIVSGKDGPVMALLQIPLPIGISFYTFEGISLLCDVLAHKDEDSARHSVVAPSFVEHLRRTGLFVAFFPHLVAGPILKARQFYPQIGDKKFGDIPWGHVFRSLVTGYFLKMVIADNLKDYTYWLSYPVFTAQNSITNLCLLFGYSIQIFADFAGYSLIAIGLAAALGYDLPQNFNGPYISRSISEFWRRWHISLSTWLRDYLYFPLGGNRKGNLRTYLNLMIVMFLGGLWHGAAWSYAVWGSYHGLGLALERLFGRNKRTASTEDTTTVSPLDIVRMAGVFTFVTLGWLLFKLNHFEQVIAFFKAEPHNLHAPMNPALVLPILIYSAPVVVYHWMRLPHAWRTPDRPTTVVPEGNLASSNPPVPRFAMSQGEVDPGPGGSGASRSALAVAVATPVISRDLAKSTGRAATPRERPIWVQSLAYGLMLALIILNSGSSNAFIYFQF